MVVVFIFVGIVIHKIYINKPYMQETINYQSVSDSLVNTWAVFMGMSVSDMPRTNKMRVFFILWVCYCLSITTVFQAFFTSFLVEPGTQKGISNLEELYATPLEYFGVTHEVYQWCSHSVRVSALVCRSIKHICVDEIVSKRFTRL